MIFEEKKKREHRAFPTKYIHYDTWLVPPKKPGATEKRKESQEETEKGSSGHTRTDYGGAQGKGGQPEGWAN